MISTIRHRAVDVALATATLASDLLTQPAPPTYELILRGGTVVDGTGAPRVRADIAVTRGHIAAIGDLSGATARPAAASASFCAWTACLSSRV